MGRNDENEDFNWDEDVNYDDSGMNWISEDDIVNTEESSLLIISSNAIDLLVVGLAHYKRDYDVLVEPLGIAKTTSIVQRTKSNCYDVIFCR